MIKKIISVTSHALDPSLWHKLSHFLGPSPLERDVPYGRPILESSIFLFPYPTVFCRCLYWVMHKYRFFTFQFVRFMPQNLYTWVNNIGPYTVLGVTRYKSNA